MNLKTVIKDNKWEKLFMSGIFGIEKEAQRINGDGTIAQTNHPHGLGNRSFHPYIQTDFAESQLELITPPVESVEEVMEWLAAIHDVSLGTMNENEYMSPFSVPSIMPTEEEIQVAKLDTEADVNYREYLVEAYGKRKQMMSGIHYNFELHPNFLKALYGKQTNYTDYKEFQTRMYLKLAHNFLRYQWVLTYLMGASIEVKEEFFKDNRIPSDIPDHFIRSLRSSKYGYVNNDDIKISFETMEKYVADIEKMVAEEKLIEEKEFYSSIRFRGGKNAREILENGIAYLEFRLFDLNPFAPYGITAEDMHFVHYFLMYLLWMDEEGGEEERETGKTMNFTTAFENPLQESAFKLEGVTLIRAILEMLKELQATDQQLAIVEEKLAAFHDPALTLGGRLVKLHEEGDNLLEWGIEKAKEYKRAAVAQPYNLTGFTDMELSTQILLFDAIQKGLSIEFLDRSDQFLALSYKDHIEFVKNGNMTSHDTYIAPLAMENKVVTKKILAKEGYSVPKSREYSRIEDALADHVLFAEKGFVIKPKSTNYGLGITVFRHGAKFENFQKAVNIAFEEDATIMIEDFVEGTEYRFFVVNDETKAVLLRVPANVTGDGVHTIEELVAEKNKNPLRGKNHRTPLEKIELGKIELLTLEEHGYQLNDIPNEGATVYLRDNSNVSTGGDSIDYTDKVHPRYKEIAVGVSKALGATISGVDMMIEDYQTPPTLEKTGYGIIEANFNPMMMMHIYPSVGKGRRLTMDIINLLFPELEGGQKGED